MISEVVAVKMLSKEVPPSPVVEELQAENEELRRRLEEAEETITAIRTGAVDALVVEEGDGHRVYTLEGAERPYRLFVEEMQQGAATLHPDGTIAWCNAQFARLLKVSQENLLGVPMHDFIAPENRSIYDNLLWQGQTRSGRGEAQLRCSDDGLVPAFLTFNALPKDCGAAIGVLVTDLTTQRHHEQLTAAHEQLRRNHDTFFNLIENAPFGVYVVDAEFRLRQVSAASQKVFSAVRPLLGRDFADVMRTIWSEPFASEAIQRFRHTLKTGEPYVATNTIETRHDIAAVESYDWRIERVTLPDGQFGVVCYFYDITERQRAEEALRVAQARLQQYAAELEARVAERTARLQETVGELEAYSYSIAHDMRAPLRAMTSFARLVQTEHGTQLDETGKGYLGRVVSAAQRLDRLVTDVLTYSRVSRMQLDFEPVDLEKLLDEAIRNQPEFQSPRVEIQIESPLPKVVAHEPSLMQCVNNLLSNAVKFVAPGVTPQIKIRGEAMDDEVRIWFEDNGIGIAAADMDRIFSLFGRLHPVAAFDGTGIGLTIVRKAMHRMGGTVGVESEPGRGSRFWIQLRRSDEE